MNKINKMNNNKVVKTEKKQKRAGSKYSSFNKLLVTSCAASAISCSLLLGSTAANCEQQELIPISMSSKGLYIGSQDSPYWLHLGGIFKIDHRAFAKERLNDFHSGSHVRDVGLDLSGGLGRDISYNLGLSFNTKDSQVSVEDAFITYNGWKNDPLAKTISIGQVNPGFCLENTSSSKWIPFLEKSMPSTAFSACPGLGFSANLWRSNYSITAAITQAKAKDVVDERGTKISSDKYRWQGSVRATYAAIVSNCDLLQVGLSAHVKNDHVSGLTFSTTPEMKGKTANSVLTTDTVGKNKILANSHYVWDVELTGQHGPFSWEAEYSQAHVNRHNTQNQGQNLKFHGYHGHVNYMLTGESKQFSANSGTLGKVVPTGSNGAWGISARHSYINLNNKDIVGGSAHNTTFALSWYVNENVRVMTEYVVSNLRNSKEIKGTNEGNHVIVARRNIRGLGLRVQAVF